MTKKSFTLIEVLVAVSLIVVVIGGFIKIENSSFDMVNRFEKNQKAFSIVSLALVDKIDHKIFLDDLIDLKDDDIRRKLKDIKVVQKVRDIDQLDYDILGIGVIEVSMKYDKKDYKFYSFKVQ